MWHFPGGSYGILQALACGCAGVAIGRFLAGEPGGLLAVWPLHPRRIALGLGGWGLAMIALLPATVLANGLWLGGEGARRHLETRAREDHACSEVTSACEAKWRARLARYLDTGPAELPAGALVLTTGPDGAATFAPGPWAGRRFVGAMVRTAVGEVVAGLAYAAFGVFVSLQLVGGRRRRFEAVVLALACFGVVLAAERGLTAFNAGAPALVVTAIFAAACVALAALLLGRRER